MRPPRVVPGRHLARQWAAADQQTNGANGPAPNPSRVSWVPPDRRRWPSLAAHRADERTIAARVRALTALARITGSEDA